MGEYTRIYDRFEWWSVDDCACEFCLHWQGKRRGCSLTACSCEDIRQEALRREQTAQNGATAQAEPVLCPA